MIRAILADVHGNLEALKAVLEDCRREKTQQLVFLGDAVGYGANPNECLSLLEKATELRVAGNHECGAVGLTDFSYFTPPARAAIEWTARVLTPESRSALRRLPLILHAGGISLAHAALHRPEDWDYILSADDARESLSRFPGKAIFIGHSHRPLIVERDPEGRLRTLDPEGTAMAEGRQYLINPGSVGQPRDRNPMAAYGIYDDVLAKYRLKRVAYDIETARDKILRAGLPPFLARRLSLGQ